MSNLYLGLVHSPIKNKRDMEVTTSVTNLDIHDIARSCRTFGFKNYLIITPVVAQHRLLDRIIGHWASDKGNDYNPDRSSALADVRVRNSIEEGIEFITEQEGVKPMVVVTGANFSEHDGDLDKFTSKMKVDNRPIFLLFGTGWGLTASVVEGADFRLLPIIGSASDGYNHLSVRSAVAIYLDRLQRSLWS